MRDISEKLKILGVSVSDNNGKYRSLENILKDLSEAYSKISNEEKTEIEELLSN